MSLPRAAPLNQSGRLARGRQAEQAVADYLVVRGFELLFANVRVGSLEIDLVGRSGALVVIVEVRTRGKGSFTSALESVTPRKRDRLLRATDRLWREKLSKLAGVERVRIDVAAVSFEGETTAVEYIEGAIVGGDGA